MIVKDPLLKNLLMDDIEFKETISQIQQKQQREDKRKDDETVKKCPKCLQNYIPAKSNYGDCCYHDGFVYDLDAQKALTRDQALEKITQIKLLNKKQQQQQQQLHTYSAIKYEANLIWSCCLALADDQGFSYGCQRDQHGLPHELKNSDLTNKDPILIVQEHFMKNQAASKKLTSFLQSQKQQTVIRLSAGLGTGNKFIDSSSYINTQQ